ncbi:S-adenosyl methyltransferase [Actinomadura madurae]|uniref:S-adenosyl methyltransferase n=1 Tax=Actinomadura madurae TaxID=1993 RepID=A0A1I5XAH3_9ACTN|nr:S-adenosyl methyltransferase [Actinomadura madurae]SPT59086.1 S-adenosyl methyltransferase [Actinomadura madurae]
MLGRDAYVKHRRDDTANSWETSVNSRNDEPARQEHEKMLDATIDTSVPHSARIWNYWLGGKDNFPVDQQAGDEYVRVFPGIIDLARHSRAFLSRAIRYLAEVEGIRQFLDVGTGLPTVDNTHEVAQRVAPNSRIVYVDNDPLVLVHARALLTSTTDGATDYVDADLYDPPAILRGARKTLDFNEPIALILNGIMGHVTDDATARDLVRRLLAGLPSGSYLALNDGTDTDEAFAEAQEGYDETGAVPYRLRRPDQVAAFFDGLTMVEPGFVPVNRWHPEPSPFEPTPDAHAYGGVGRKD